MIKVAFIHLKKLFLVRKKNTIKMFSKITYNIQKYI